MNHLIMLVTLRCLDQLKGERSIYSIFHLYKGKRSSQTLQDANLYNIKPYFGILPQISRTVLEEIIEYLYKNNYIETFKKSYIITTKGKMYLQSERSLFLNGWLYSPIASIFWDRLCVLIQTLSNIIHFNNRFIPIVRDPNVLQWVKNFLTKQSLPREEIANTLYRELYNCLSKLTDQQATIFVRKLTGRKRIGSTNEQISNLLSISSHEVQLQFISTLHFILHQVEKNREDFQILGQIITEKKQRIMTLTASTQKTYQLLCRDYSIDEISMIRKLKKNTIEDHVVEIAHQYSEFSISHFVDDNQARLIEDCIRTMKTNQLKVVKEALSIDVSYFQIRLVLAKVGGSV
ncbi:helix-turn-helix domain-containing protein [Bacillus salitolerans]|uniref:Helix-turn-helix domain-containing protein n=1 Tax=Bacillus salitolerans TaxID=1437434 RepID=A0ABW4LUW1_9BACI